MRENRRQMKRSKEMSRFEAPGLFGVCNWKICEMKIKWEIKCTFFGRGRSCENRQRNRHNGSNSASKSTCDEVGERLFGPISRPHKTKDEKYSRSKR